MSLTCLFLQNWDVSLTLHPSANTGIKVACVLWNGSTAHLLSAQLSVNTNQLRFRANHNNDG